MGHGGRWGLAGWRTPSLSDRMSRLYKYSLPLCFGIYSDHLHRCPVFQSHIYTTTSTQHISTAHLNHTHQSHISSNKSTPFTQTTPRVLVIMCLFSSPKKHHRAAYVEEVYVAPRPVSRHSHHSHHHGGRSSYTSVTRTSRPVSRGYVAPRMSQSSYRHSTPVVVQSRTSTRSYR